MDLRFYGTHADSGFYAYAGKLRKFAQHGKDFLRHIVLNDADAVSADKCWYADAFQ